MKFVKFTVSLVVCGLAAFAGSLFTTPKIPTWYAALNKPFFNPPNWIFAPVWTALYLMMGIAAFLVWQQGFEAPRVKKALGIFVLQLTLNVLWSYVFFGLQSTLGGLVVIILLWGAILATIIVFFRQSNIAGWLLIPYIAWVSFATILNAAIYALNI